MNTINTPTRKGGRKATLVGGTRINIYMDTASRATAKLLGRGNVSEGIRLALMDNGFCALTHAQMLQIAEFSVNSVKIDDKSIALSI